MPHLVTTDDFAARAHPTPITSAGLHAVFVLKESQRAIEMGHHHRFDCGQIIGMDILVPLARIAIKFGQGIAADRRPAFIIDRLASHQIHIPEAQISTT